VLASKKSQKLKSMTKKPPKRSQKKTRKVAKTARTPQKGEALLDQMIGLTGIPAQVIQKELKAILEAKNIDIQNLTVDQLRLVVASYVRQIMRGLADKCGYRKGDPQH
jgi:hypothetical protein